MIYTGPVDAFFDFCFGKLPYRSLEFRPETQNVRTFQPVGTGNFPNEYAYTRVTEFKHLTGQEHEKTSIVYEYPRSEGDPYYPVPRRENAALQSMRRLLTPRRSHVRRPPATTAFNMHQIVGQALATFRRPTRRGAPGLSKEDTARGRSGTGFSR
jgi:UDP-galactopyranose mutase